MGFNPLVFTDLLALCAHLGFGDWELELIERIDNAVTSVAAEKARQPTGQGAEIPIDDAQGLKAWARGMATRVRDG